MRPPRNYSGSSRPSSRFASVTVSSVPRAVADGTRIGTRAARSDAQRAAGVDVGDRSAAGANSVNVDDRQPDGKIADRRFRGHANPAVDQADVGGRAPHVERDDPRVACRSRDRTGADDSRRWTGEDRLHRGRLGRRGEIDPPFDCMMLRRDPASRSSSAVR